jgi:negative regulator of the PHO system
MTFSDTNTNTNTDINLNTNKRRKLNNSPYETTVQVGHKHYILNLQKYLDSFYDNEGFLANGSFGKVYKVKNKEKTNSFAIKCFQNADYFEKEMDIMRFLQEKKSENIIKLFHIFIQDDFQEGCFVLELADMDLFQFSLQNKKDFTNIKIKNIFRQIITGLQVCHENGIIHCDLKPNNILVFDQGNRICLGDFGSSFRLEDDKASVSGLTLPYQPPEMLLNDRISFDFSIDIWSCAITMLQIIKKKYIFYSISKIGMLFQIFQTFGSPKRYCYLRNCHHWQENLFPNFLEKKKFWTKIDTNHSDLKFILKIMLNYNPHDRPSTQKILKILE